MHTFDSAGPPAHPGHPPPWERRGHAVPRPLSRVRARANGRLRPPPVPSRRGAHVGLRRGEVVAKLQHAPHQPTKSLADAAIKVTVYGVWPRFPRRTCTARRPAGGRGGVEAGWADAPPHQPWDGRALLAVVEPSRTRGKGGGPDGVGRARNREDFQTV